MPEPPAPPCVFPLYQPPPPPPPVLTVPSVPLTDELVAPAPPPVTGDEVVAQAKTSQKAFDDLVKQVEAPVAEQAERESLTARLETALEEAKGQGKRELEVREELGLKENLERLKNLSTQIAALEGSYDLGIQE